MALNLTTDPEFMKLNFIGGCRAYHNEGSAMNHTIMVAKAAGEMWKNDVFFLRIAYLHDVGKIYTGKPKNGDPDDWEYPGHSPKGGEVLDKFMDPQDPDFEATKWFVRNHIKPLFWIGKPEEQVKKEWEFLLGKAPNDPRCTIQNLAKLAICDILGSWATSPQVKLLNYLYKVAEMG